MAITGDVTFSPDRITFENGRSLPLAFAGETPAFQAYGQTVKASLFRIPRPDDPVLLGGSRLCGGAPVTFIALWRRTRSGGDMDARDIAVFSGDAPPASDADSCGTFSYEAGAAG
jgi:hypothetical protein